MNDVGPSFFRASVFFLCVPSFSCVLVFFLCVPSAEVLDVQGFFSAT